MANITDIAVLIGAIATALLGVWRIASASVAALRRPLEQIETRLALADAEFRAHVERTASDRQYFDYKFERIDKHFDHLNGTVHEHDRDIGVIKTTVARIEGRIDGEHGEHGGKK